MLFHSYLWSMCLDVFHICLSFPLLFDYVKGGRSILLKGVGYNFYICHGNLTTLILYHYFVVCPPSWEMHCHHQRGGRICIYMFAGIIFARLSWPKWFWWWQHYEVKFSSEVMIKLLCLGDHDVKANLFRITPYVKRHSMES